jgi:hypothetical protein
VHQRGSGEKALPGKLDLGFAREGIGQAGSGDVLLHGVIPVFVWDKIHITVAEGSREFGGQPLSKMQIHAEPTCRSLHTPGSPPKRASGIHHFRVMLTEEE